MILWAQGRLSLQSLQMTSRQAIGWVIMDESSVPSLEKEPLS